MWMGGFTFYAEVVIPTATVVLGSERNVGFITQKVTGWINLIGLAAMAVFLWNMIAEWRVLTPPRRWIIGAAFALMVLCSIGLFATHPLMDSHLDAAEHKIRDYDHFVVLHNIYLTFATAQWIAALTYLWISMAAWRTADRAELSIPRK